MNILVNIPISLFENRTAKQYTGPLHFSSMLMKEFAKRKVSFSAIVFKRTKAEKTFFKSRIVKQGRNNWIVLEVWIPTAKIIKQDSDKETRMVIDGLKKAIKTVNPDVFYLNGFSALAFIIMQAVHELNIPMITTHHGVWFREYMALRPDLIKSSIEDRKELERNIVRFASKNIFLSDLSLRVFEKNLIKIPKNQLEFVKIPYNPTFLNKSYPKANKNKKLNIALVGRWDAVKNHEAYLELAKLAKKKKLPWTFYAVCNIGPYPHYDEIRNEYQKIIKVVPTMSADKLKQFYKKANVIVVPSHFDVYPGVVTESILQNRPILISEHVGWTDDFKRHGVEHWISDFSKPEKVIAKLKQVSNEQVPRSLYNEVLTNNKPEFVFDQYFRLFKQLAQ